MARDLEHERDALNSMVRAQMAPHLSDRARERQHAQKQRQHAKRGAALEAFGRLLDFEREPQRADLAQVARAFPGVAPRLRLMLRLKWGEGFYLARLDGNTTEEATEGEAQPEPDWSDGATVAELATAYGCSGANVRKAIGVLRQREKTDGMDWKTRRLWPPEHAREIWAHLLRNGRNS